MKKPLIFIAIIILVVLAALNAVLVMPPTAWIKTTLVDGVRARTGLELDIKGRIAVRFIPDLRLVLDDVDLLQPASPGSQPVLSARTVEVDTPLWPLLQGRYDVDRVKLIEPRITLAVDKTGKLGWVPALAAKPALATAQPAENSPSRTVAAPNPSGAGAGGADAGKPGAQPSTSPASPSPSSPSDMPAASARPLVRSLVFTAASIAYRDERDGVIASLTNADGDATDIATSGVGAANLTNGNVDVAFARDGSTLVVRSMKGSATRLQADRLAQIQFDGQSLRWRNERTRSEATAEPFSGKAANVTSLTAGTVAVSSGAVRWRDDNRAASMAARDVVVQAGSIADGALRSVTLTSSGIVDERAGLPAAIRSAGSLSVLPLTDVSLALPELAMARPIEAEVAFQWNGDRVSGRTRLPPPDMLALSITPDSAIPRPPVATTFALTGKNADVAFEGEIATGAALRFTGRTTAKTPSLVALSNWLGIAFPAQASGALTVSGDLDATTQRTTLTNGRIEHEGTVVDGALTVDLAGARPVVSGRLSSDRIDANPYFGWPSPPAATSRGVSATSSGPDAAAPPVQTSPPVPVKDALKAYMRATLAASQNRSGSPAIADVSLDDLMRAHVARPSANGRPGVTPEWSDQVIDLSAMRAVDLDIEWTVKSLAIHDFDVAVPRLKAVLKGGELVLDGERLATRGGHLSGTAKIDARQPVPHLTTSFIADGIDVYDLLRSIGVTALIAGTSTVEADLTGTGASQKQVAETVSGRVKASIGKGSIVGYDFSSVLGWLFGDRTWDPSQRTPFDRLDTTVAFDNGVARSSNAQLTGPVIGGSAEGTIKLPAREIDYHARFKLASFFSALSLRIFGEWDRPSVTPDLGDVFSRSPAAGDTRGSNAPALMSPVEMLARADLEDAELAGLIGQVLDGAGQRGLPPQVVEALRELQVRAQAQPRTDARP